MNRRYASMSGASPGVLPPRLTCRRRAWRHFGGNAPASTRASRSTIASWDGVRAVKRWIVANGGDPARATGFAAQAARGRAKQALTRLTYDEWKRAYKVVEDGEAIADNMSVGEIDADIGGWSQTLVADN